MKNKKLKILLAAPRGFCAGVDRAIEIVKKSINKFGPPVYVRHEIVQNKYFRLDVIYSFCSRLYNFKYWQLLGNVWKYFFLDSLHGFFSSFF